MEVSTIDVAVERLILGHRLIGEGLTSEARFAAVVPARASNSARAVALRAGATAMVSSTMVVVDSLTTTPETSPSASITDTRDDATAAW